MPARKPKISIEQTSILEGVPDTSIETTIIDVKIQQELPKFAFHETVQALMCGEVVPYSQLQQGQYVLKLYEGVPIKTSYSIFDFERIECSSKQFEIAKSKILNSTFGNILEIPDIIYVNESLEDVIHGEIVDKKIEGKPKKTKNQKVQKDGDIDEKYECIKSDKLNGVIFSIIYTNFEYGIETQNWNYRDNISKSIIDFMLELYNGISIDDNSKLALEKKFLSSDESFGYEKIAPMKARDELLSFLLQGVILTIGKNSKPEDKLLFKVIKKIIESEYDVKTMTNQAYLNELFSEYSSTNNDREFDDIRKIILKTHRDGGYTEFDTVEKSGPKTLNAIFVKRIVYSILYGFSSIQGDIKTRLFNISDRKTVSSYFWSDGGKTLKMNYSEIKNTGLGNIGECISLLRSVKWSIEDHLSDNMPRIVIDLLYQNNDQNKRFQEKQLSDAKKIVSLEEEKRILEEEKRILEVKLRRFERSEIERIKQDMLKLSAETSKELFEMLKSLLNQFSEVKEAGKKSKLTKKSSVNI